MDSQSVKNTDTAGHKGYDAGKKVSGIKRHIAVDTQGLPHGIHVTTADVTDRAGALAMFDRRRDGLSQVQNVLVDGGYTGKPFATAVQGLLGEALPLRLFYVVRRASSDGLPNAFYQPAPIKHLGCRIITNDAVA